MTFLAPMFLIAGTALLVPVVLHLLKRQVAKNLVFPSVRFIRKGKLPRTGRRRLRDIPLLIARCLLFAAVVLLFAQPFLRNSPMAGATVSNEVRRPIIFLLDRSASMSGKGRLAAARAAVADEIKANPGVRYALVLSPGDAAFDDVGFTIDGPAIVAAVEKTSPLPVKGAHAEAIERTQQLLTEELRALVCVVSDFQHSDWAPSRLTPLPMEADLKLIDVASGPIANVGVVNVHHRRLSNGNVRLLADIRNFGNASTTVTATFSAGDETVSRSLEVPARSSRKVAGLLKKPETMIGSVRISEDDYSLDDVFHVWLGGAPPARVLIAAPLSKEPRKRNAVFFVEKALDVKSSSLSRGFQVDMVDSDFFSAIPLNKADALFLPDSCGYFDENDFRRLRDFLRRGGVVLCTPGDAVGHQFLGLRRNGLLDCEFFGLEKVEPVGGSPVGISWIAPKSFLADLFDNPEDGDLFTFPIRRFVKIKTRPPVETLLKLDEDWPALVRSRVGEGTLYAMTFALSPLWSDLPLSNSFLPLIRELFMAALPNDGGAVEIECGTEPPEEFVVSNGEKIDTREPGVSVVNDRALMVNVSRDESITDRQPLGSVRAALTTKSDSRIDAATPPRSAKSAGAFSLWPLLAILAGIFFLVELGLARTVEQRGTSGPSASE